LTNLLAFFCSFIALLAFVPIIIASIPKGTPRPPFIGMTLGIGGFVLLIGALVYPLYIILWGLAAHLILRMGSDGPAYGLRHTFTTLCFASGANAINMIPCLGTYSAVGTIWWLVSAAIALKHSQKVSGLKAACAAVIPPLLIFTTCFGSYFGLIFFAISKASTMAAARSAAFTPNDFIMTQTMMTALTTRASTTS
jgi:hypothetical protein